MTFRPCARLAIAAAAVLLFASNLMAHSRTYEILRTPSGIPDEISQVLVLPGGCIWLATDSGPVRMDYDRYRHYTSSQGEIPGDAVRGLSFDYKGRLWAVTDAGLSLYDKSADKFEPVLMDVSGSMQPVRAYSFTELDDRLLMGGAGVLYVYDYKSGSVSVNSTFDADASFVVDAIYPGRSGYLLLFNKTEGFREYSALTGEVLPVSYEIKDSHCFCMDRQGRFWRSVYGRGVECYDRDGRLIYSYTGQNSALSCDFITSIAEGDGQMWVGTESGGVNIIHPDSGQIEVLRRDHDDPDSFPCNGITSLTCDYNGTVWAAMQGGGVVRIKESASRSLVVSSSAGHDGRSVAMPVTAVLADDSLAGAWAGTQSDGLYRYVRQTGELTHCQSTGTMSVEALASFGGDRLMLHDGRDLYLFSKSSGQLSTFRYADSDLSASLCSGSVSLQNDSDGNLLVLSDAIYLIDCRTGNINRVSTPSDASGVFRAVTCADGEFVYDSGWIYSLSSDSSELSPVVGLDGLRTGSVSVDAQGCFWAAADDGLYRKALTDTTFARIETDWFSAATMVVCADDGRVWVGAGEDLYAYNPESGLFAIADSSDGIHPCTYFPSAVSLSADGHILLGGAVCLTDLDTRETSTSPDPVMTLMSVSVDGEPQSISSTVRLPRSYVRMHARAFACEDNILRKKMFRFHVKGPGTDDVFTSSQPECELSYHRTGRYTVEASCTTASGAWTEPSHLLTFRVRGPLGLILSLAALLLAVMYLIAQYFASQRKMALQHDADKERLKFLLNVSHELKTPLTLIIGPLERLMEEEEKGSRRYKRMVGIRRQALRMRTLILTVLDSHKIEEGAAALNAAPVDINKWVSGIALDFQDEMEGRGIALKLQMSDALSIVPIDADKLINVLTNMLINALKHSPNDTTITVGTKLLEDGRMMRAYVSDQGSGLGGVDMTKLFGRYYQAMTEKTGTGMGLAYSDSIVRLHGGAMGAFENPGGGSTFYFDIPVGNA